MSAPSVAPPAERADGRAHRQSRARTAIAIVALLVAAAGGLWWGPGRGVGTDDQVQRIATPSYESARASWRDRIAPASSTDERVRFALIGVCALCVLIVALAVHHRRDAR